MTYTHGHADAVLRSHRWRTVENSAAYLAGRLEPGRSLLDVGCGPGTLTVDLARRLAPGRVVGIDAEEGVLEEARAHAAAAGVDNVEFHPGEAYALAFDDGSFDLVHAHQVLQHLAEPARALDEMARVCRPGGTVAARDADYPSFAWYPADPLLDRWMELYCAVTRANGGWPDAGRRLKAFAFEAGLRTVSCSASVWCFATDSERSWWGELWAERVTASRMAERSLELGLATPDELDEIAGAWLRWTRRPEGFFSVPHGELLAAV